MLNPVWRNRWTNKVLRSLRSLATTENAEPQTPISQIAFKRLSADTTNNVITVTKIQVALLASAQPTIAQTPPTSDGDRPDIIQSLRETTSALLEDADTWTHAGACSKTVKTHRAAKTEYEAFSVEERSRPNVEQATELENPPAQNDSDRPPARYRVFTLLAGTTCDKALLEQPLSIEEVKTALQKLKSLAPDDLKMYEIFQFPQAQNNSLSDSELLTFYPKMVQINQTHQDKSTSSNLPE